MYTINSMRTSFSDSFPNKEKSNKSRPWQKIQGVEVGLFCTILWTNSFHTGKMVKYIKSSADS